MLANSLLTDSSMWGYIIPFLLSGNTSVLGSSSSSSKVSESTSASRTYNVLLHSQRGHGLSTLPSSSSSPTPIPSLAIDIVALLHSLEIPLPVHSIVGVSQGGAAALALAGLYESNSSAPWLTKGIVACDTAPRTPAGNQSAWEERIALVHGGGDDDEATSGMERLARVTVPRWFPPGSSCHPTSSPKPERSQWVHDMITRTPVPGFVAGARGLGDYDTYDLGRTEGRKFGVLESDVPHVLLVAGQLDGGGKVGSGMRSLAGEWEAARNARSSSIQRSAVRYEEIPSAGHLPMIDNPGSFWAVLGPFLASF